MARVADLREPTMRAPRRPDAPEADTRARACLPERHAAICRPRSMQRRLRRAITPTPPAPHRQFACSRSD
jgi:hypothetical protein